MLTVSRVRWIPLLALAALALAASCFAPAARAEDFTGKVVAISDGDTITVLRGETQEKVRLEGIDCPEKGQAFGDKAKKFTGDLAFGKEARVAFKTRDRYGRIVGEVTLPDGKCLNRELVSAGMAMWYRAYSKDRELEKLELDAKQARRGIWSEKAPPTPPWEFRRAEAARRAAAKAGKSGKGDKTEGPSTASESDKQAKRANAEPAKKKLKKPNKTKNAKKSEPKTKTGSATESEPQTAQETVQK